MRIEAILFVGLMMLMLGVIGFNAVGKGLYTERRSRFTQLHAGKGFGKGRTSDSDFPSIDAFAKDPALLIKDRNEMAMMPPMPSMDQFSKDREKKFDFNDLEFPTRFTLKVIGLDENNFLHDVLTMCSAITKEDASKIRHGVKNGRKGNYLSVSVAPLFSSGDQIYQLYEVLHLDSRVKFVL